MALNETATSGSNPLTTKAILILILLLSGVMCTASIVPFMGYFIVEGLGEPPWKISLYAVATLVVTMLTNRALGERIDAGQRIAPMVLVALVGFIAACSIVLLFKNFWALLGIASLCFGLSFTAGSTMYSFGRLYAEREGLNTSVYNSYLRAITSLGWMIAPALSFLIANQFGSMAVFKTALGLACLWGVLWWAVMPRDFAAPVKTCKETTSKEPVNTALWLAAAVCLFFAIAHVLCASALPLFYVTEAGLPTYAPGLSLSIKTGVEIVAILGTPWIIRRFGARRALLGAGAIALTAFAVLSRVASLPHLVIGAALEGLYYGIFAGVGITYMQDLSAGRIARATSLYMNSLFLGALLASSSMGLIAQAFDFRTAIQLSAIWALIALGLLLIPVPLRRQNLDGR